MTTTPQDPEYAAELAEMHDVVTKVVQLLLDNCPEGFAATDVADAIVDVCSDEMHRLYAALAERDEYRDSLLPVWEAVYEPGNVSDYLIGYTNDVIPAKRAAEAWFRAQRLDEPGAVDWISDPVMAVREYDVWHELVEVGDDFEVLSKPGIIVRHRVTPATTLEG